MAVAERKAQSRAGKSGSARFGSRGDGSVLRPARKRQGPREWEWRGTPRRRETSRRRVRSSSEPPPGTRCVPRGERRARISPVYTRESIVVVSGRVFAAPGIAGFRKIGLWDTSRGPAPPEDSAGVGSRDACSRMSGHSGTRQSEILTSRRTRDPWRAQDPENCLVQSLTTAQDGIAEEVSRV